MINVAVRSLALAAALLSGCDQLPWTAEHRAVEAIRARLSDPASAQFRNLRPGKAPDLTCGEVNSRNRLGGYVGFRPFVVGEGEILLDSGADPDGFAKSYLLFCDPLDQ